MENHQLINSTSCSVEYFTPPEIIEAARSCMGGIDIDPASSVRANQNVGAKCWFGFDPVGHLVDGLFQEWHGRAWVNHPFGRPEKACVSGCLKKHKHHDYDLHGNAAWINKLETEYDDGRVTEACCITFACTSEKWFQPLLRQPQCYLVPRTNYYLPDGSILKGVTKGSVVTYFGERVDKFRSAFSELGVVKI